MGATKGKVLCVSLFVPHILGYKARHVELDLNKNKKQFDTNRVGVLGPMRLTFLMQIFSKL
jgi:hypothetical protein